MDTEFYTSGLWRILNVRKECKMFQKKTDWRVYINFFFFILIDYSTINWTKSLSKHSCITWIILFFSQPRQRKGHRVGLRQQDSCFLLSAILPSTSCYLHCVFLQSPILSWHCLCCQSLVSPYPCLSSLSSSDSGAWIPPPAQRSGLQSLPAAAGHRHPLRGHQTVSFTLPVCKELSGRDPSGMFEPEAVLISGYDAAKSSLRFTWVLVSGV